MKKLLLLLGALVVGVLIWCWWTWEPPQATRPRPKPETDQIQLEHCFPAEGKRGGFDAMTRTALETIDGWRADAQKADWPSSLTIVSTRKMGTDRLEIQAAYVKELRVQVNMVVGSDVPLISLARPDGSRARTVRLGPMPQKEFTRSESILAAFGSIVELRKIHWLDANCLLVDLLQLEGGEQSTRVDHIERTTDQITFRATIQSQPFTVHLTRADTWRLTRIEIPPKRISLDQTR